MALRFDREEFGRRMRAARERIGLTQAEAADLVGIPQPRIQEYEAGQHVPRLDKLMEFIHRANYDPRIIFSEWFAGEEARYRVPVDVGLAMTERN
jgi:transcriptional regulator with XRE-family HTH domain